MINIIKHLNFFNEIVKKYISKIYTFLIKKHKVKTIVLTLLIVFLISSLVIVSDIQITNYSNPYLYSNVNQTPSNKTGLILGTSKYLKNGRLNLYFKNRIKAASDLYNAGKIDYIVISGDNSKPEYNEPKDMKDELLKLGIPSDKIYLDYAGFRTYDSMVRMNKIFGQSKFTVISQEFHNQRAVFIGRKLGYNVIGFNAVDVNIYTGLKTQIREKFARINTFIDLLIGKEPKFLGEKIIVQ